MLSVNVLWILLLGTSLHFLPFSGNRAGERLDNLNKHQLQQKASWARRVLRVGWRTVTAVVIIMPMVQIGLASLTNRSPIPSLIEFAAWLAIAALLASPLRRGSLRVVAAAKERNVELPPRRSSAKARRNGLLVAGAAVLLGAAAVAVGTLAGTSTTVEQALITTLGTASALAFLAALVAGLAYYGDEKTRPVTLP